MPIPSFPRGLVKVAVGALLGVSAAGEAPAARAVATWNALHFSTGTSFNHTLAVGDLNGDGRLDVASPNSQTSAVTVLLGNGDGTLSPFQAYATFSQPQDVVMADLTGDGVVDLATADYTGGGVTLLRGLGDGTFATRVAYPVGAGLVSLVATDLDGDTRLDLAISKEAGNKIAVLPALLGGGFGPALEVTTGAIPHQVGTTDLDHDGEPDLVVASNGAAAVSVHLGNGTHLPGTAAPFPAGGAPIGLTIADLNEDGDADLLVSNVNAATLSVLLGNGDGTFALPVAYAADPRPRGIAAGDLDGDGVPDVVVATGYPDADSVLTVYRGIGDGTLAILDHLRLPYRAADCVIADMNQDGHADIVATGPQAGVVSILLNPRGDVSVPPAASPALGLELEIQPNPARSWISFRFRSPPGLQATLEVFDPAGRQVARFGPFAGDQDRRAVWRGERMDGGIAEPGLYLVRLMAGGNSLARRVVLLNR